MEIVSFIFILATLSSVSGKFFEKIWENRRHGGVVLEIVFRWFSIGKICPGYCVPTELCTGHEGKVVGYCVNGRACCDGGSIKIH